MSGRYAAGLRGVGALANTAHMFRKPAVAYEARPCPRGSGSAVTFGGIRKPAARIRDLTDVWWHAGGNVLVVLIQIYNWYSRFEHGSAAILPVGLILSLIVVGILLFTGWKGWEMVYRHRVGVADDTGVGPGSTIPVEPSAERRRAA